MRLDFDSYSAVISGETVSVFLDGRRFAELNIASSLDSADGRDTDGPLSQPQVSRYEDGVDVTWHTRSSLWEAKSCRWRFEEGLLWYELSVKGRNALGELRFFDGASRTKRWSLFDFSRYFTPECNLLDQRYFRSAEYGCIDASSGPMNGIPRNSLADCHWIFTPPPLCYCLGFGAGRWLAAGVAPEKGQYGFSRFQYKVGPNSFHFGLTYDGMTRVDGEWTSPKLVLIPSADEYSTISNYCDLLRKWELVSPNPHRREEWWSRPIFCGWGEQNVTAARLGVPSNTLANQETYDRFLEIIRQKRLDPGTIVIDDKWQASYGTCEVDTAKWPDLRGWIDARHAEGRRVLLWFGAWNTEGLPPEETITNPQGGIACADPTSPAYRARIREMMRRMLSSDPGCCNADGIKYDWTNGVPFGPGYELHGDAWGIELMKLLTQQVYDALKAAKSDALMITHTANPYFAECTDMIRLNDISAESREIVDMMTHRQRLARIACPHALIDCDNSSAPNHTEWLEYTRMQPQLGVPSLYFLTAVDGTMEEITDEDWDMLGPIWRA